MSSESNVLLKDQDAYTKYRGKCKEFALAAAAANPTLHIQRGWYFCPIWNSHEEHWWCVNDKGEIHDPTREQFPSRGLGSYVAYEGVYPCMECGTHVVEEQASAESHPGFCSSQCYGRCVGVSFSGSNT